MKEQRVCACAQKHLERFRFGSPLFHSGFQFHYFILTPVQYDDVTVLERVTTLPKEKKNNNTLN